MSGAFRKYDHQPLVNLISYMSGLCRFTCKCMSRESVTNVTFIYERQLLGTDWAKNETLCSFQQENVPLLGLGQSLKPSLRTKVIDRKDV